jgi:hypothetical protein
VAGQSGMASGSKHKQGVPGRVLSHFLDKEAQIVSFNLLLRKLFQERGIEVRGGSPLAGCTC